MKIILIIMALMVALAGRGQDSLLFYLSEAAQNNPVVLQKYIEYNAVLQKIPQVGNLPDPELNMGVFLSPMELVNGNQVADLRLMQMFPWFGTLRAAKDEMSLMANAKYESFRNSKLQLFYQVQQTWYDMYKVKQNINIAEKNINILRTIERLALVKFRTAPLGGSFSSSGGTVPAGMAQRSAGASQVMGSMGGKTENIGDAVSQNQVPQGVPGNSMGSSASGSSLADLYRIQIEIGELENNTSLLKNR